MRRMTLVLLGFLFMSCGGSSRSTASRGQGSGDDDSAGGSAGSSPGGKGGSSTTQGGSGATDPTGGVSGDPAGGASGVGASPSITSCTDEFPFAGEWQGNVLDYFFEPIEEVRLSVRAEEGGAGGYVGELTWGTGEPPPPATDPNAPYPPGFMGGAAGSSGGQRWPGFPYTIVRGAGCDTAFRVSVSNAQTWETWCAIQTPIDGGEYGWGCMLRTGSYGGNNMTCQVQDQQGNVVAEYPAWRCELCGFFNPVCECSQSGCTYNHEATFSVDLTLSQSGGVDVLSGPDTTCGDCTIRLERVE
jgi:hypothetical protein